MKRELNISVLDQEEEEEDEPHLLNDNSGIRISSSGDGYLLEQDDAAKPEESISSSL